ncbi:MAG: quercetin 2,3-dioxygenase [Gemmatimonadetes bacterium]|nr:quercetin 2,3-dioxygenase [Gemmatimonadota bacterium]
MTIPSGGPFVLGPEEGDDLWILGGLYSFKALGATSGGAYTLCEVQGPAGFAIPMHIHEHEEEGFYLARGEATLFVSDDEHRLAAGAFGFVPRGHRHCFRLDSADARLLLLVSPGDAGHEAMFRAMGEPAGRHAVPAAEEVQTPDLETLPSIAARHGTRIVGPPPGSDPA